MSSSVSTNYRELAQHEIAEVAASCAEAWKSADIPARQYAIVKPELENYRKGGACAPFDALVRCLKRLPEEMKWPETKFLDVGASAGYYLEILRQASFHCDYAACDFSPAFKALAEELYPGINFDVADARQLPYESGSFDIVLSGCVMLHTLEYEQVLAETARVTRQYALFHRTPVLTTKPTAFYVKEAYQVPCLEIWFNEQELLSLFRKYGLSVIWQYDVFFDFSESRGHREYLVRKDDVAYHPV